MKKIFIYSSTDGQTQKICEVLKGKDKESIIDSIDNININSLSNFDHVILGASVRYGDHHKKLYKFVINNKSLLESKKTAFFSVNATARKFNKNSPSTNPYIIKFLRKTNWTPDIMTVFAGKIDYLNYNFFDKYIIKLIMWITNGPTDTSKCHEFTNWEKVEAFSKEIEFFNPKMH